MRKILLYVAVLHNYTGNESDFSKSVDIREYEEETSIDVIHEYDSYIDSGVDIIHEYEWENDCQENDCQENDCQENDSWENDSQDSDSQIQVRNDCRQVPTKQAATATKGMASTLS